MEEKEKYQISGRRIAVLYRKWSFLSWSWRGEDPFFVLHHAFGSLYFTGNATPKYWVRIWRTPHAAEEEKASHGEMPPMVLGSRKTCGSFASLYQDLRAHPDKFHSYFWMTVQSFDELLQHVLWRIQRQDTHLQRWVPPVQCLMVTLSILLVMYCTFSWALDSFIIFFSFFSFFGYRWELRRYHFTINSGQESPQLLCFSGTRRAIANFPNCMGALDGKHIRIKNPLRSGSLYFNFKKYCSILLIAILGAQYRWTAVDSGGQRFGEATILESLRPLQ